MFYYRWSWSRSSEFGLTQNGVAWIRRDCTQPRRFHDSFDDARKCIRYRTGRTIPSTPTPFYLIALHFHDPPACSGGGGLAAWIGHAHADCCASVDLRQVGDRTASNLHRRYARSLPASNALIQLLSFASVVHSANVRPRTASADVPYANRH